MFSLKLLHPILLLIALCCFSERIIAQQNLVPNGDFEYYTQCPNAASQVIRCTGWNTGSQTSSDFFHSCAPTSSNVSVPVNFIGYQYAVSGNGYTGGVVFSPNHNLREYVYRHITPLKKGFSYEVSVSVSLRNSSYYATNNIGVLFYDTGINVTQNLLPGTPQVFYNNYSPYSDTQGWTRLTKTFVPDSAYDNIVLGGFLPSSSITPDTVAYGNSGFSYYYFDSLVIKALPTFIVDIDSDSYCAGDTLEVEYGVYPTYNSSNVFTLQLSDKNGSFVNPVNIGSKNNSSSGNISGIIPNTVANGNGYRMRVISSSPADTSDTTTVAIKIGNIDSSNVVVSITDTICTVDTLKLSANTNVFSTTYNWIGPGSFNTNNADTNVTNPQINNSGVYYSTIRFYGCAILDTFSVLVKPTPAKPAVNSNTPLCAGDTLKLTGSSTTSGVTYSWTGPSSFTSSQQNPVIPNSTTGMSGIYTQTATLNGCDKSDTTSVTVKPYPLSTTLGSNAPLCDGDTLKLNSTASTTGTIYNWSGPLSYTANNQNTTRANASSSMSGYYKLLLDLNGCTVLDSIQATIHPIPARPTVTANNPLCVGDTLMLSATSNNGTTYSWSGPTNFSSPLQNPDRINITLADAGTYIVNATANNCTSPSDSVSVNINPAPFVVILSNKDSICVGDLVTFTALPNNAGGTPTYQWYVNGQQATSTGSTFTTTTLQNNAIVKVDMTEYAKCANPYTDPSNDIQMRVLPWLAPGVSITANPNGPVPPNQYITFTATPTDAGANPGYQWKRNGNNVVGANGMTWSANTLNDNDSISVHVISNYMCPQPKTEESNGIVVKILTGVGEIAREGALQVYPNPNNGRFIISGAVTQTGGTITAEVINAIGQKVYHKEMQVQNHKLHQEVELPAVASGSYLLRLQDEAGKLSVYKLNIH